LQAPPAYRRDLCRLEPRAASRGRRRAVTLSIRPEGQRTISQNLLNRTSPPGIAGEFFLFDCLRATSAPVARSRACGHNTFSRGGNVDGTKHIRAQRSHRRSEPAMEAEGDMPRGLRRLNHRGFLLPLCGFLFCQRSLAALTHLCSSRPSSQTCCPDCSGTFQALFHPAAFGLGLYCRPRNTPVN
jgi:hypothetical protein